MVRSFICVLFLMSTFCPSIYGASSSYGLNDSLRSVRYVSVDSIALAIPMENTVSVSALAEYIINRFPSNEDRIRAAYVWISNNIKYNVFTTFTSRNEENDEARQIQQTLTERKGVCKEFALLFCDLARKIGFQSYVIDGYNKAGSVVLPDPHEWCAARINSRWYLFDPTWGAGYVDNYRFVPSPNDRYFMLSPEELLCTHMPFDPIWQFRERPYSYKEFDTGVVDSLRDVPRFAWEDSIKVYSRQDWMERLESATARMLENGEENELVEYALQLNRANLQIGKDAQAIQIYNVAMEFQNKAVDAINLFIRYRNASFEPKKEEEEIRKMITDPEMLVIRADSTINTIRVVSPKYKDAIINLKESIVDLSTRIYKQRLFIEQYFATKPSLRKNLFIRR